ncbi:MAG: pyridoxal phosphate-dependent aminotransferase [Planctomycetota bacterium]
MSESTPTIDQSQFAPSTPNDTDSFLQPMPPMGIYETLYAFQAAFGQPMGQVGTHPWSQGFPRTDQLPDGPALPDSVAVSSDNLRYPKAWGLPALRQQIATYYRTHYGATIDADNVMIFAGGRPALLSVLLFLQKNIGIRIASTEYTPYYDILERLGVPYDVISSNIENGFCPSIDDYAAAGSQPRSMMLLSNPCNPTGITRSGAEIDALVAAASTADRGLLIDEAYEMFHDPPISALAHIEDIEKTNVFVIGAATKGLQAPGIRIGWAIAAKRHIEILGNFSSFGMGGVSHPSQCYALELMKDARIEQVRRAVPAFYGQQRERYGEAFEKLGLKLFSGDGGVYHWCQLPAGLSANQLNQRLFADGAAILKGTDCDMLRRGDQSPLNEFFRFSFGPLAPESFEQDIEILARALNR